MEASDKEANAARADGTAHDADAATARSTTLEDDAKAICLELINHNDKVLSNCRYQNKVMEGHLRKRVNTVKLFQKELYPKRYFFIDFQTGFIKITANEQAKDNSGGKLQVVEFADVKDCFPVPEESQKIMILFSAK